MIMVGKCIRKRDYSIGSYKMDSNYVKENSVLEEEGNKRLKLTSIECSSGGESSSMSPSSDKSCPTEIELMLDSGCDCLPMDTHSSNVPMEEDDEEPYIDVVSEDSAIHDEDNIEALEEEYGVENSASYENMVSHMDTIISSQDDNAIIKSEIFESVNDPVYGEMHQIFDSTETDYEDNFLNSVDACSVSSLLDKSDTDLIFTTTNTNESMKDDTIHSLNHSGTIFSASQLAASSPAKETLVCDHHLNMSNTPSSVSRDHTSIDITIPTVVKPTALHTAEDQQLPVASMSNNNNNTLLSEHNNNVSLAADGDVCQSQNSASHADGTDGVSIQAQLVSAPSMMSNLPNPVIDINNLNAASILGGNAPVLTTPVFLAQGAPGPGGQTSSIITTHLARLVPSPDGKGYILHLGLSPQSPNSSNSNNVDSITTCVDQQLKTSTSIAYNDNLSNLNDSHSCTTNVVSSSLPVMSNNNVAAIVKSEDNQFYSYNPSVSEPNGYKIADSNIKLLQHQNSCSGGGEQIHSPVILTGVTPVPTGSSIVSDQSSNAAVSTLLREGSLAESQKSPPVLKKLAASNVTNIVTGGVEQVGDVNVVDENSQLGYISAISTAGSSEAMSSNCMSDLSQGLMNNSSTLTTSALTRTQISLLDTKLLEQTQHQIQFLQQLQQNQSRAKSKRRNSKELKELMELEQITGKAGDTDRFVICSDGPMNCALCGYNTGSYSSFKSHIICSHPCWRITKKLSRNRLLVEKSVKVSVPVANFSVPNPIPAVPIQQRVQSKKSKNVSSGIATASKITAHVDSCPKEITPAKDFEQISNSKESQVQDCSSTDSKENTKTDKEASCSTSSSNNAKSDKSSGDLQSSDAGNTLPTAAKKIDNENTTLKKRKKSEVLTSTDTQKNIPAIKSDDIDNKSDIKKASVQTTIKEKVNAPEGKRCIYKCTRCLRLFVSEETTVNHVLNSHFVRKPYTCIEISNDYGKSFSAMYGCPHKTCSYSCESYTDMEKHKSEFHAQQVVYRCQICGFSADSTKAVKEHATKIHKQQVMMYGLND